MMVPCLLQSLPTLASDQMHIQVSVNKYRKQKVMSVKCYIFKLS